MGWAEPDEMIRKAICAWLAGHVIRPRVRVGWVLNDYWLKQLQAKEVMPVAGDGRPKPELQTIAVTGDHRAVETSDSSHPILDVYEEERLSTQNVLANIFKYTQLALAGVVVAEQVFQQEPGATKQQKALDIINGEAQVIGIAVPQVASIAPSIVNMAVAAFNIADLFQHKAKTP